jgi:hypothetical protein
MHLRDPTLPGFDLVAEGLGLSLPWTLLENTLDICNIFGYNFYIRTLADPSIQL